MEDKDMKNKDTVIKCDSVYKIFGPNAEKMLASGIFQEPIANEPALQTMFEEVKAGL